MLYAYIHIVSHEIHTHAQTHSISEEKYEAGEGDNEEGWSKGGGRSRVFKKGFTDGKIDEERYEEVKLQMLGIIGS